MIYNELRFSFKQTQQNGREIGCKSTTNILDMQILDKILLTIFTKVIQNKNASR
jgi:hypothetical protein